MNILITGGNGKLGQNVVERLQKFNKIIFFTRNIEKTKRIFKKNENLFLYHCDLEKYNDIEVCMQKINNDFDKIDIIINNAALDIDQPMIETTREDFEKIMKVNLFAPYFICQKIIPKMKKNNFGKIINISSDLSIRTVKNATEYSITKAGLDALTRSIAVEYGEYGIIANSININGMKGYTTKVNENNIFSKNDNDYDDWKQPKERIPLNRRGNFDEFVNVIEFLCSDKSNYISGVSLSVDGGIIAKL